MALTLEDGTGVSGADSYRSQANIEAYADAHGISRTLWDAATTAQKDAWARDGALVLDSKWHRLFPGIQTKLDQGLLWPRFDALDKEGFLRPSDTVPVEIADAQSRLTLLASNGTDIKADVATATAIEELRAASGAGIKFAAPINVVQFREVGYILEKLVMGGGKWFKVPATRLGSAARAAI